MKTGLFKIVYATLVAFLVLSQNAFAYLDPGTGSYVLQIAFAVLFGALFMLKTFWEKVKTFFYGIFSKKEKNDNSLE